MYPAGATLRRTVWAFMSLPSAFPERDPCAYTTHACIVGIIRRQHLPTPLVGVRVRIASLARPRSGTRQMPICAGISKSCRLASPLGAFAAPRTTLSTTLASRSGIKRHFCHCQCSVAATRQATCILTLLMALLSPTTALRTCFRASYGNCLGRVLRRRM